MAVVELNVIAKREPPPLPKGGIKLEIGKRYRDKEGGIIGPMRKWDPADTHKGHPVLCCSNFGYVYYSDTGLFVGRENNPDFPSHIVSEVWEFEKEEKAWKEGKPIEYSDPKGLLTPKGEWRSVLPYEAVCLHYEKAYAETHLRNYQVQYRIKQ